VVGENRGVKKLWLNSIPMQVSRRMGKEVRAETVKETHREEGEGSAEQGGPTEWSNAESRLVEIKERREGAQLE